MYRVPCLLVMYCMCVCVWVRSPVHIYPTETICLSFLLSSVTSERAHHPPTAWPSPISPTPHRAALQFSAHLFLQNMGLRLSPSWKCPQRTCVLGFRVESICETLASTTSSTTMCLGSVVVSIYCMIWVWTKMGRTCNYSSVQGRTNTYMRCLFLYRIIKYRAAEIYAQEKVMEVMQQGI